MNYILLMLRNSILPQKKGKTKFNQFRVHLCFDLSIALQHGIEDWLACGKNVSGSLVVFHLIQHSLEIKLTLKRKRFNQVHMLLLYYKVKFKRWYALCSDTELSSQLFAWTKYWEHSSNKPQCVSYDRTWLFIIYDHRYIQCRPQQVMFILRASNVKKRTE